MTIVSGIWSENGLYDNSWLSARANRFFPRPLALALSKLTIDSRFPFTYHARRATA
jgi:hypothetical protein